MIKLVVVGLYLGLGSYGGINNYIKLLLNQIDKNEFDLHYYSLGKSPNWYEGQDKPSMLNFIIYQLKRIILFIFFLKKNKIEVVHFNSGLSRLSILREGILATIANFVGCKTLFYIHGWKEKELEKILKNNFLKKVLINILKKQDAIAVLAQDFKIKLNKIGVNKRKIFVTTTMVESSKYLPKDKDLLGPYKILTCVNMIKDKGIFELLDAVPKVLEKYPNSEFIFAGEGKDQNKIKEKTKKMNLEKNVKFPGYISGENKYEIFKNAQIFAFPSYTEGFPTVILEAMAAGDALIFTPVGGLKDTLKDGKNGYVIKSNPPNPNEISEKIIKLINNPQLIKEMSDNNIKRAREEFDINIVSKGIINLYRKIQNDRNYDNSYC